jgi:hypothetical protein
VTIRNSRIRAIANAAGYSIHWATVTGTGQPPTGLLLEDVEIDGHGTSGPAVGPYPSGSALSAAIEPGIG